MLLRGYKNVELMKGEQVSISNVEYYLSRTYDGSYDYNIPRILCITS